METFTTTRCGAHDHPEVTIQLAQSSPIPNVERLLIDYFETAVRRGSRFLPGQTIRLGWALLRLSQRSDGTLGVEERELTPELTWTESVDRALRDVWYQKEVVDSVGLVDAIAFPSQDDGVLVSECALGASEVVMVRLAADDELPEDFSGWAIACTEDHDHGEESVLPLLAIAANKPGLVQMLALPHGTSVLVLYREKRDAPEGVARIEPHVFRDGEELSPKPGSYLAALQGP